MSRHRKDSVPRHRAQRRENGPGRGVPVSAAGWAARLLNGRTFRSLFVTPWFAAGVGVVIAATLVLGLPTNAVLSYGPVSPWVPCKAHGCGVAGARQVPDSLATARPGVQLNVAGTRNAGPGQAGTGHAEAAGQRPAKATVIVDFSVLQQGHNGFIAVITLRGTPDLGAWTLSFTIPGASIEGVGGAKWRGNPDGDGGVAQAQPSPWRLHGALARIARIVIFGSGRPGQPTGCVFDGTSCAFG